LIILDANYHRSFFTQISNGPCRLHSKCLKEDESLEKCKVAECQNVIHPGCSNKLMTRNEENWLYFLRHFQNAGLANSITFFMSYRDRGLINAMRKVFPDMDCNLPIM